MIKIKQIHFIILYIFILHISCAGKEIRIIADHPDEVKSIQKTWEEFVEAAEKKDFNKLKSFLMDPVRCQLCLENTDEESREMDALREKNQDGFYMIYQKKINIPADRFIQEDVPLLFGDQMIERLKKRRTEYIERDMDGIIHFEIMVTTTEANEVYEGLEGAQHVFDFLKTAKGYKLAEISTIP